MKPICQVCDVRGPELSCGVVTWKCSLCSTKQKHECSCELCTYEEEIVKEEKFIDDIIEFKPYFELGE